MVARGRASRSAARSPNAGTAYGGLAPLRPGDQLGLLVVFPHNISQSPLPISSIRVPGQGVGTVMRIFEMRLGPGTGKGLASSAYQTDPPVSWAGSCQMQPLVPVHGYRMAPGGRALIWEVIQAERPGHYFAQQNIVFYTQNGTQYREAIPRGYEGSVARKAPYVPLDPPAARCVHRTKTRVLRNIR